MHNSEQNYFQAVLSIVFDKKNLDSMLFFSILNLSSTEYIGVVGLKA